MIKELSLLIPLLQNAGEGAFWLILAYLVKEVLIFLMWPAAVVIVALAVARTVRGVHKVEEYNWRLRADLSGALRASGYLNGENWVGDPQLLKLSVLLKNNPFKRDQD